MLLSVSSCSLQCKVTIDIATVFDINLLKAQWIGGDKLLWK